MERHEELGGNEWGGLSLISSNLVAPIALRWEWPQNWCQAKQDDSGEEGNTYLQGNVTFFIFDLKGSEVKRHLNDLINDISVSPQVKCNLLSSFHRMVHFFLMTSKLNSVRLYACYNAILSLSVGNSSLVLSFTIVAVWSAPCQAFWPICPTKTSLHTAWCKRVSS